MTATDSSLTWETLAEASLTNDAERFTNAAKGLRWARHRKPGSPKWRGAAAIAAQVTGALLVAAITAAGVASAAVVPPAFPGVAPQIVMAVMSGPAAHQSPGITSKAAR